MVQAPVLFFFSPDKHEPGQPFKVFRTRIVFPTAQIHVVAEANPPEGLCAPRQLVSRSTNQFSGRKRGAPSPEHVDVARIRPIRIRAHFSPSSPSFPPSPSSPSSRPSCQPLQICLPTYLYRTSTLLPRPGSRLSPALHGGSALLARTRDKKHSDPTIRRAWTATHKPTSTSSRPTMPTGFLTRAHEPCRPAPPSLLRRRLTPRTRTTP